MELCSLCRNQDNKSVRTRPHEAMIAMDEARMYVGHPGRNHEEQDYQCGQCQARWTYSTDKNDYAWTLWRF